MEVYEKNSQVEAMKVESIKLEAICNVGFILSIFGGLQGAQ